MELLKKTFHPVPEAVPSLKSKPLTQHGLSSHPQALQGNLCLAKHLGEELHSYKYELGSMTAFVLCRERVKQHPSSLLH